LVVGIRGVVCGVAFPEHIHELPAFSLFLTNLPYNCSERELQEWVESREIATRSIHIVRDLVAGVSPAFGYVELNDDNAIKEAVVTLNGKKMRNQIILVKEALGRG
jgi:RNA recognition motif-containing protein